MLSHAIEVLGWTLLHFVWQGAVVGVLAAAMLLVLRRRSANARYLTAVSALGLMLLLPLGTMAWIEQTPPVGEVAPIFNTVSTIEIPRTRDDGTLALDEPPIKVERIGIDFENPPPADAVPLIPVSDTGKTILEDLAEQRSAFDAESFLKPFIPWAVAVWLIGVGVLSLRLFASWLSVLRLRWRATQPASADWQAMLGRLAERLRVTRPVKLVESALVEVPAVIGWLRPIILLPASAMTGLTTEQLEALLAHELAHVRRHDYLINLLQTVVETLLFYHPAIWWLSHRIRVEREHCCDDLAASVSGDRLSYAKALVAMEELRNFKPRLAMSARDGSLSHRIGRLLGRAEPQRSVVGWISGVASCVMLAVAIALGTFVASHADAEKPKVETPDTPMPVVISEFKRLLNDDLSIGVNQVIDEESPAALSARTVRGELLSADGVPVANARIILLRGGGYWSEHYRSNLAVTNDAGKFTVRGEVQMEQLAIDADGVAWMFDLPAKPDEVVIRLPPLIDASLKLDRPLELQDRRVWLQSVDARNGNFRLLRKPEGTLDESGAAKIRIPAGRYLVGGSKRLNSEDGEPIWGWSAIGEVTIRPEAKSEAVIQRFTGSRISGQIKNVSDLLKNAKADHAEVTVSMTIDDNGRVEEFPFDNALCNEAGEFRLGPVPFGRAVLRVNGVDRPGQNRPFRQQPRLAKHRLTLAKRLEVVELPPDEPDDSIATRIAAILDSEQPLDVSWSHTDVQVAQLRTLTPKEDVSRELIRLMNDPQTTDNWLHVVIRALGELRPVTADIKTALLNGANNPKLHRRAEMIGELGDMRADAADLIDAISQFKDSPDVSLRGSALRALGTINKSLPQESPQLTAALIAGLNDPVIFIRKEAVGFLGQQKSEAGIAELRQHLRTDPSGPVRALCAWAIYKKTDEVDEPLKVLIELLQSADLNDRFEAAIYLDLFDARAKPAIPALEANTKFQDKPPFSNSRDTKRYQLTSAAQRVLKKLQMADEPVKQGRIEGRVRLKTEKPLPDLEQVKLPPGKILDESLVFSKDGGLANVFVYLRKPTFKFEEPTEVADPKPFVLTSSGGRFLPHLALVRVGRPLEFANVDKSQLNFRTAPLKNAPENRLVPPEERVSVPAFNVAENLPVQVGSNMYPWMSAWMFPLDHPFAAVTDAKGHFSIDGLPPGEHEFRVWHERVGYLNKKLVITIKSGEETRTELEYEPSRFGLSDDRLRAWSLEVIDVKQPVLPRPKVPPAGTTPVVGQRRPDVENTNRHIREQLTRLTEVAFSDTPLSDVMTFLGDYHSIEVTFDASSQARVQDPSIVPITLTMTEEDLATVLQTVLHSVRLNYFIADGKLQIATAGEVKKRGHPVPESLEEILAKLQKADASVPWEGFLLGSGVDSDGAAVANAANLAKLIKLLSHPDVVVQRHAAAKLSWFGNKAAPAQSVLEKLTESDDRNVRRAAWHALLSIGSEDLSTWPLFLAAWIEGDDVVNRDWAHILNRFDPQVFDKLTKLFPTASVGIRQAIASSIRARPSNPLTQPLALLALEDSDRSVRSIALTSSHHELSQPIIVALRKRLLDEHPPCRTLAASRLLDTESDREAAMDVLLQELGSDDASRKAEATRAFLIHGHQLSPWPVRDLLLRRTVSPDESQRLAARQALKCFVEETQTIGVLKHVDLLFESRQNELKLSPAQRVQSLDVEMHDLLTRNNPSEEQRARVNHRAAQQFANWDIRQHFALVKKYAEAGLKLDVDPHRRASLHSLLGSAALVDSGAKSFVEQRRSAAKHWLNGYREVVSLKLPKTAPELPVVEKLGDIDGDSPEQLAERQQRHAAQVEARQQAEFLRQMIEHRQQLARLCVENYRRDPADEPELRKLATEALTAKSLVDTLLAEGAIPLVEQPVPGAGREPPSAERGSPDPAQKPTEGLPNSGDDAKRKQNDEKTKKGDLRSDEAAGAGDPRRAQAIERAVGFLKGQQAESGQWPEHMPSMNGGVSSLCTLALLQAGVKPDDAVIQKALASLRKIKPDKTYTVALQTMVFCATSPKEDAELIRQNVAWLEKTQFAVGRVQGGWSYQAGSVGSGDGSNTRFAVMSLLAAKKAGFDVQAETWQRVSEYYLTTQTAEGGWGYSGPGQASLSMTLAGVAGLASANRHLPQNEPMKAREAALQKSAEYLEKKLSIEGTVPATLYALHCLERAGHVSGLTQFDKLGWTADATKRLLDQQGPSGSWSGTGAGENTDLIGTSLALLTLTGRPEPKLVARRLRIQPRDPKGTMQVQTSVIQTSTPPRRRIEFSGGVRIEAIEPDGSKWRIEAGQAIIETGTEVKNDFEFSSDGEVLRIVCQGSVKIEGEKGDQLTRLTAENLELDLQNGGGWLNQSHIRP